MIQRWYELTCDYCGCGINHYIAHKPNRDRLEADRVVCTATKQFCSEKCLAEWNHDRQAKQYMNLRQRGRIH